MRSTVFRFDDFAALALALQDAGGAELPAPEGEAGPDGEWVLAIFEVGVRRKATAAAARIVVRHGERAVLFEERDWDRLMGFALARSGHYKAIRGGAASTSSNYPILTADETLPPVSGAPSSNASNASSASSGAPSAGRDSALPGGPLSSRIPPSRILIVDDDDATRELITRTLEALGLTVVAMLTAEDGAAALAARAFDLVVVDYGLPRGAGLSLVRSLRKSEATALTPALFIAESGGSRDAVEAFASGADDFVTKPLRASELSARIIGLLRRARVSVPPERR